MVMLAQLEIMTQNIKHTQQRTNEFAAKVEAVEISFQKHVEGKFTVVADSYEAMRGVIQSVNDTGAENTTLAMAQSQADLSAVQG